MIEVLLVVHLLVTISMVSVILLQRSEGGALGIGGGGNNMMTGRGAANLLTRVTAILAALFFGLSIALAILASNRTGGGSIVESVPQSEAPVEPATPAAPSVPTSN